MPAICVSSDTKTTTTTTTKTTIPNLLKDFISTFNTVTDNGYITLSQFLEYYSNSAAYDDDASCPSYAYVFYHHHHYLFLMMTMTMMMSVWIVFVVYVYVS